MLGMNQMVVLYDPEHPDEMPLQVAYRVGRWVTLRAARSEAVDLSRLREGVERIQTSLQMLADARRQMSTAAQCQHRASELITQYERGVRATIDLPRYVASMIVHRRSGGARGDLAISPMSLGVGTVRANALLATVLIPCLRCGLEPGQGPFGPRLAQQRHRSRRHGGEYC